MDIKSYILSKKYIDDSLEETVETPEKAYYNLRDLAAASTSA